MDFENLKSRKNDLINYLRANGYAETYINRYNTTVSQITKNADANVWNSYHDIYSWYSGLQYASSYLRELRAILGKLERFDLYGIYPDGSRKNSLVKDRSSYCQLSPKFQKLIDFYCEVEGRRGLKESTIYSASHKTASFFLALQEKGEDSLEDITEASVLSCFSSGGKVLRGCTCKRNIASVLKVCLSLNECECRRILTYLPDLRSSRKNIQYLTNEECTKIRIALDDPDNDLTYKNRAIGMLLMYTGIRGGDVASMMLDSIDWERDKIFIVQRKTQEPLELPLTAIVGNAIYDYCAFERPNTRDPHLFLSNFAPHGPLTTDGIGSSVSRIMKNAGMRQNFGARKGTHIFRHRVATSLLGNGISQAVISGTLGQTAPFSLEPYLYADFPHLKECALSIEQFPVLEEVFAHV